MPCTRLFDQQDAAWKTTVLGKGIPRFAIEAAHPDFWNKYVREEDCIIGLPDFGESAPAPALYAHFGITASRLSDRIRQHLAN